MFPCRRSPVYLDLLFVYYACKCIIFTNLLESLDTAKLLNVRQVFFIMDGTKIKHYLSAILFCDYFHIIVSTNLILTILLINRNNVFKPNVIHHSKSLGLNRDKYILIQRLCFCHIFLLFGFNLLYILNYVICGTTEQSIFPCWKDVWKKVLFSCRSFQTLQKLYLYLYNSINNVDDNAASFYILIDTSKIMVL